MGMMRQKHGLARSATESKVNGRRKRGRPRRRQLNLVRDDIKEKELLGEGVNGCATWKRMSSNIDRT